jgi:hypothetical protein
VGERTGFWVFVVWQVGSVATFFYLTFFDDFEYNWWNWLIAIPANVFLGEIWPIYWFILRPWYEGCAPLTC